MTTWIVLLIVFVGVLVYKVAEDDRIAREEAELFELECELFKKILEEDK